MTERKIIKMKHDVLVVIVYPNIMLVTQHNDSRYWLPT